MYWVKNISIAPIIHCFLQSFAAELNWPWVIRMVSRSKLNGNRHQPVKREESLHLVTTAIFTKN